MRHNSDIKCGSIRGLDPLKIDNAQSELLDLHIDITKQAQPLKEAFSIVEKKYREDIDQLNNTLLKKLDEYYDTILLDKNSTPVKIGNIIQKADKKYKVVDRCMQFVFSDFMFNSRVLVKKLQPDNSVKPHGTVIHLRSTDLQDFTIINL